MAACMQWKIVSSRWQEVTSGIGQTGYRWSPFIPRVVNMAVMGLYDLAGTLQSILSFKILSTGLFLFCFFPFTKPGKFYVANSW